MTVEEQKAKLIKDALLVVNELATLDTGDDCELIDDLIEKASKLKKDRLWKLR